MVGFRRKRCAPLHAQACSGPCGPRSDEWWRAPILNQLLKAFAAAEDLGVAFHSAQFAVALAFPGFGSPTARRVNGRLFREHRRGNWRGRNEKRPRRHGDDGGRRARRPGRSRAPERKPRARSAAPKNRHRRRRLAKSGWCRSPRTRVPHPGAPHGQQERWTRPAMVRAMNSSTSLCRQVWPHRCLELGAQTVARVPTADAQLARLLARDEPMVGLFLFRSANVARNGLADHPAPPVPLPGAVAASCRDRGPRVLRSAHGRRVAIPAATKSFIAGMGLRVERAGRESLPFSILEQRRPERFQFGTVRR